MINDSETMSLIHFVYQRAIIGWFRCCFERLAESVTKGTHRKTDVTCL
jgi:hypothetical protein